MTTETVHTSRLCETDAGPGRRFWQAFLGVVAGFDAAARIIHGFRVAEDHPARRQRDRAELERRLTTRYPRT